MFPGMQWVVLSTDVEFCGVVSARFHASSSVAFVLYAYDMVPLF